MIGLLVASCMSISLTGCNKKDSTVETPVVQETEDKFAVNDNINVGNVSNGEFSASNSADVFGEDGSNEVENTETTADVAEGIAEEEKKAALDESIAAEESQEYEDYLNSDSRLEVYMTYDRTERNNIIVYYDVDDTTRDEFSIAIDGVTEGIDELAQGDEVCVICNGAFTDDNEFAKVYQIVNVTKQIQENEESDALEDEYDDDLETENVAE